MIRGRPSDAAQIWPLARDLATSFPLDREVFDQSFASALAGDAAIHVALSHGVAVGYVLAFRHQAFYANGPVVWVEELMVRDDYRGQGVGRALMQAAEDWAVAHGAKLVALATRRAEVFYDKLGYRPSATYFSKLLPASGCAPDCCAE